MKKETTITQGNYATVPTNKSKGSVGSVVNGIFNVLFVFVFSLTVELLIISVFLNTVASNLNIQPLLSFSEESIREFLASSDPILLCSMLLLFFLLLIVLTNRKSVKNLFLSVGISFALSGLFSILTGIFSDGIINLMPTAIKSMIFDTNYILGKLLAIGSLILFLIASVFISLFLMINYVKRTGAKS